MSIQKIAYALAKKAGQDTFKQIMKTANQPVAIAKALTLQDGKKAADFLKEQGILSRVVSNANGTEILVLPMLADVAVNILNNFPEKAKITILTKEPATPTPTSAPAPAPVAEEPEADLPPAPEGEGFEEEDELPEGDAVLEPGNLRKSDKRALMYFCHNKLREPKKRKDGRIGPLWDESRAWVIARNAADILKKNEAPIVNDGSKMYLAVEALKRIIERNLEQALKEGMRIVSEHDTKKGNSLIEKAQKLRERAEGGAPPPPGPFAPGPGRKRSSEIINKLIKAARYLEKKI
jgi:hypothetical protein